MTPIERKQIASAFKEARKALRARKFIFICPVLAELHRNGHLGAAMAKDIISKRMGANPINPTRPYTLEGWLAVHGIITHHIPFTKPGMDTMRAYRLRWLDALIQEFSE